ncbi:NCS2 family nucleobase:cation symporter [Brachybacterium sp. NBEC-018]|uniref:uracil-xanthine permease family protein n=1 Tax=Brachybacterium sp. NBEC-018 TaxID=2996004 RepID=UPI0021750384|nr:solute carrier family 23 protein [Brachybacterium sp. NBEC-018]UVY83921.1 NCS2 family nucleobase:cation symporter [Brachybacterium sp. NBEC-018]
MFRWTLHGDGRTVAPTAIVRPEERLAWPLTVGIGAQHVVAMFGATFLVPVITGFPPSTTLLFSGLGTLLFLLLTRNRVPSYLGSSFAFIAPITASTQADSMGAALGGVLVTGLLLAALGLVVQKVGTGWISRLMPPVVMGSIVALIGLNLVPSSYENNFSKAPVTAALTLVAIILCTALFKGLLGRISVLIGVIVGYVIAVLRGEVDFSPVRDADWLGLPEFHHPTFDLTLLPIFLPVIVVLLAENVGHVTSVGLMTGRNLDHMVGRTLTADGLATALSATFGGSPTTTYGENIGVMSATRVYSTAAYWVAGIVAILLSLSPKVGAVINTIPAGVLGGVTFVLYGLIAIVGFRMWVDGKVDFSRPKNQITAGVSLTIAIADLHWQLGGFAFTGIALGTLAALAIYHGMGGLGRLTGTDAPAGDAAAEPVAAGPATSQS